MELHPLCARVPCAQGVYFFLPRFSAKPSLRPSAIPAAAARAMTSAHFPGGSDQQAKLTEKFFK